RRAISARERRQQTQIRQVQYRDRAPLADGWLERGEDLFELPAERFQRDPTAQVVRPRPERDPARVGVDRDRELPGDDVAQRRAADPQVDQLCPLRQPGRDERHPAVLRRPFIIASAAVEAAYFFAL